MNVTITLSADQVAEIARQVAELVEPPKEEPWLTPEQAAKAWGAPSADAIRKRARRGSIESKREGKRLLLVRRGTSNEGWTRGAESPTM